MTTSAPPTWNQRPTPAPPRRRSGAQIALATATATATAVLLIAVIVLTVLLTRAHAATDDAQSHADRANQQVTQLQDEATGLQDQLATAQGDVQSARDQADAAQEQVDTWRSAGAGDAAFLNTVYQQAPSYRIAEDTDVLSLGRSACAALARGVDRQTIVNVATSPPWTRADATVLLTSAETFLC